MSVVEAIYLVAAVLWMLVVVAAACVGGHYLFKLRARRRQVAGFFDTVRLSIERAIDPYRAVAAGGAVVFQRVVSARNVFASFVQLIIAASPAARNTASRSRHLSRPSVLRYRRGAALDR